MKAGKGNTLLRSSKKVIKSLSLINGAVVAADTDRLDYPANAKPYRYVWPRDASFCCVAADILGLKGVADGFFTWAFERAYGVSENGIFLENYHTNGVPNIQTGYPQLDQTGSVLWAIHNHLKGKRTKNKLVRRLGDGLVNMWEGDHFDIAYTDLWEERTTKPDLLQEHVYSLSCCSKGLALAYEMTGKKSYLMASDQMAQRLNSYKGRFFPRTLGKKKDRRVDASLLGLIWPFDILDASDKRTKASLKRIEKRLCDKKGGVMRYEKDTYDGVMKGPKQVDAGAGTWPLLSLWMSIAMKKIGEKEKATHYLRYVEDRFEDIMPEQSHSRGSVAPLGWSHSMYVIAKHEVVKI